jgi:putative ABC transport system permease protein
MRDWNGWVREQLSLPPMEGHREERIIAEIADHLEGSYRDALSRGASPDEAEARAEGELGSAADASAELLHTERRHRSAEVRRRLERVEDRARRRGGVWASLADGMRDIRLALRALGGRPGFSATVVVILAVGIGATTAIFTLLDAVVLSPLPFDAADRLVRIAHVQQGAGGGNVGQCAAWHFTYEDENRVFQDLGMWFNGTAAITGTGEPEAVPLMVTTGGVFRALRLNPVVGRGITAEDEDPDSPPVIVLGHGYWMRRFGGDPEVIGRTLQVNGTPAEIVGVASPELQGVGVDPGVIAPLQVDKSTLFVGNIGASAVARLREGITLEQANADVARMLPMAFEKFPGGPVIESMRRAQINPAVQPFKSWIVGSAANLLWILMVGVAAVLLIACANVANLFLVRAEARTGEMAVRTAMGASGARIGWEFLKESLLLGVAGGVVGLALAQVGLRALVSGDASQLPRLQELSLSPGVFLFTVGVSVACGLLFGMVPVVRQRRGDVADALKSGRAASGRRRGRTGGVLAVVQMALALLVMVASGLMLRTALALSSVDPGFREPEDVLAMRLYIPAADAPTADDLATQYEAIVHRLEEVPGVTGVALGNAIPMDGFGNVNPFYAEGQAHDAAEPSVTRRHKWIGQGYFETLRIPLVAGRAFTWHDIHDRLAVAVVSESLARTYWGSAEAAMGQKVAARPDPPQWYEVIGVAGDVREFGLSQDPPVQVYWPLVTLAFWQGNAPDAPNAWRGMGIAVRSHRVGNADLLGEVRDAVWSVNSNLPVRNLRTLDELEAQSMTRTSFSLRLLGIAAAVALMLGVIGVYGVLAHAVSQRIAELGMRIALGAPVRRVMGMVLREGLTLAFAGVAIGLVFAVGLARLMASLLYGVSPVDPLTYGAVAAALVAVAAAASWLPARRAARIDPMTALRAE